MIDLIKLIRAHQWIKNGFLFIPGFFAGVAFEPDNIYNLLLGFISFSFVASSIYIINDYNDIEADRNHPEKKNRPLASGKVKPATALVVMAAMLITGLGIGFYADLGFFIVLCIYFISNLGYSLGLKNISILDVLILASGFLLRTIAGGFIIDVPLSSWLMIMIFLLALFLALAKRMDDQIVNLNSGKVSRNNVKKYNMEFITSGITMVSGIIIVSYIMYTISDEVTQRLNTEHLYFTGIFVIAGIMRYLQITLVEQNSGSPTKILYKDKFIITTLIGWIVSFFIIIYQ